MSFIVKGIDLPKEGRTVIIEVFPNGRCSVMEIEAGECYDLEIRSKAEAVQIPKGHGDIKDINTFLKDKSLYEYIENDVFSKKYGYSVGIGAIYNAPTILEEEEET